MADPFDPVMELAAPTVVPSLRPKLTVEIGPMLETQWTGIPVFTRRLVEALLQDQRLDVSFCFHLTAIPTEKIIAAIKSGTGVFLRQAFEDASYASYKEIDAGAPLLYPSVKKSFSVSVNEASTVHDISTLVMPDNHEEANVCHHMADLRHELETNSVNFCVSEATRAALQTYFPSTTPRNRVMYQYVDWPDNFQLMDRNLPRIKLGRYAVVIGTIEPRKNLAVLLRALTLPELQQSDLKFVIIGKIGWLVDEFLAQLTPAQRERLVFSGFVSVFVKYRLIAAAEFMVFPSLYEGFGIPALEALSLGKPVLAALTSSFPEVIGDAGIYFDPLSATEFAAGLMEIETPSRLAELSRLALPQSEKFSPERMAAPVVEWMGGIW